MDANEVNFQMMPPTRLGKMINLMKKSNDSTMKSLMTPKSFRIIKMLSLDYSENCAICKFYDVTSLMPDIDPASWEHQRTSV